MPNEEVGYFGITSRKGKHTLCGYGGVCRKTRLELSQFTTLAVLLISFVIWVLHCIDQKVNAEATRTADELFYEVAGPLFPLFVAVLYYFAGAWLVECKLDHFLPSSRGSRRAEIAIRGGLLILLPLSFVAIDSIPWLTPYIALCIYFVLMIIWDMIVYFSATLEGGHQVALLFGTCDGICIVLAGGYLIAEAYEWKWGPNICTCMLAIVVVVAAFKCLNLIGTNTFPKPEWAKPLRARTDIP